MSKVAISITIDSDLLSLLKEKAQESNRTLSNYIQYALVDYLSTNQKKELTSSYEDAIGIEKNFKIYSYQETESAIENSIRLSDAAIKFAKSL